MEQDYGLINAGPMVQVSVLNLGGIMAYSPGQSHGGIMDLEGLLDITESLDMPEVCDIYPNLSELLH